VVLLGEVVLGSVIAGQVCNWLGALAASLVSQSIVGHVVAHLLSNDFAFLGCLEVARAA